MSELIKIIQEEIKIFSESKINDVVWRAGKIELMPYNGGIWFGENKKDVEKFTSSVRNEKRVGKPYKITMNNPKYYDGFWREYLNDVDKYSNNNNRDVLMNNLISAGYDGIIIDTDTWNDTGNENAVTSKQYVVFDKNNISPA